MFTEFIVEHNLPLACADHTGPLFRKMFPDSTIATKYGCARTKTSCVLETLASDDAKGTVSQMKSQSFSLATDGSNDIGAAKLYPVCARYFDFEFAQYFDFNIGKVMCVMLSLKECREASTGEKNFQNP